MGRAWSWGRPDVPNEEMQPLTCPDCGAQWWLTMRQAMVYAEVGTILYCPKGHQISTLRMVPKKR